MKKKIVVAGAAMASLGAWAQDALSIYGMVDQFVQHGKSGPTGFTKMVDGGDVASRIGFRGGDDLGGGTRLNFVLEAGFNANTGAGNLPGPGLAFTRQAYVGIGNKWGALEAGHMYMPLFYSVARADPFGANAVFSPLQLRGATDAQQGLVGVAARGDNLLRYRTSAASPVVVDIAYSFSEALQSSAGEMFGSRLGWDRDGVYVAYAYQSTRAAATASIPTSSRTEYHALNASYDVSDALRLNANWIRNRSSLSTVADATIVNLGMTWRVTDVSYVLAGITRRSVAGSPRGQTGGTLGYNYNLSKRTAVYGRFGFVSNRDKAAVGYAGVAVGANSGDSVRTFGIGLSHKF